MPVFVSDVIRAMEEFAPPELAEGWDNCGLLVGRGGAGVNRVLLALDATHEVILEAQEIGAEMIVSHHPVIFKPMERLTDETPAGERVLAAAERGIAIYSAHTNLDSTAGGVNDALLSLLEIGGGQELLFEESPNPFARIVKLDRELTLGELADRVREKLGLNSIRYVGKADSRVKTAAVICGAGSKTEYFSEARAVGCDVFLTGDIGFHHAQFALEIGLCLVDFMHYPSEVPVLPVLQKHLQKKLDAEILISQIDGQVFKTL